MDCLEFANISFHSSASIGHLCEDLCASAFRSIFDDDPKKISLRPVWVGTENGKEF